MTRDGIYSSDFGWETRIGLAIILEDLDGHDGRLDNSTLENWAWIYFQLKEMPDMPDYFPRGKWATIQHIEGLLTEASQTSVEKLKNEVGENG